MTRLRSLWLVRLLLLMTVSACHPSPEELDQIAQGEFAAHREAVLQRTEAIERARRSIAQRSERASLLTTVPAGASGSTIFSFASETSHISRETQTGIPANVYDLLDPPSYGGFWRRLESEEIGKRIATTSDLFLAFDYLVVVRVEDRANPRLVSADTFEGGGIFAVACLFDLGDESLLGCFPAPGRNQASHRTDNGTAGIEHVIVEEDLSAHLVSNLTANVRTRLTELDGFR